MTEEPSQRSRVLRYIREEGGITTWEAIQQFGITRLSRCVFDLKRIDGIELESEWVERTNRYGDAVKFKRYFLGTSERKGYVPPVRVPFGTGVLEQKRVQQGYGDAPKVPVEQVSRSSSDTGRNTQGTFGFEEQEYGTVLPTSEGTSEQEGRDEESQGGTGS